MKAVKAKAVFCLFCILVFPLKVFAISDESGQIIVDRLYNYLKEGNLPSLGVVDIKAGIDAMSAFSNRNQIIELYRYSSVPSIGFTISAEYLKPINSLFKAGAGISYLTPRQADVLNKNEGNISYFSFYLILQVNPIWYLNVLYFKANAGYSFFYFKSQTSNQSIIDIFGGPSFGLAMGFPISSTGWSIEISYNVYFSRVEYTKDVYSVNTFRKLGIMLFKRFKLSDL